MKLFDLWFSNGAGYEDRDEENILIVANNLEEAKARYFKILADKFSHGNYDTSESYPKDFVVEITEIDGYKFKFYKD